MNFLRNIDDDRSDEELEDVFGVNAETDGDVQMMVWISRIWAEFEQPYQTFLCYVSIITT